MPRRSGGQSRTSRVEEERDPMFKTENRLAWDMYKKERFTEAESLFRQVYRQRKKVLGRYNVHTLKCKYMVACTLFGQENYREAETLFQEVVRQQAKVLGNDDYDTMRSKFWSARTLYTLEKYEEAELLLREVVQQQERVLGGDHTRTLQSRHYLALTLKEEKKYREAEQLLRVLVQRHEMILGENHKHTLKNQELLQQVVFATSPSAPKSARSNTASGPTDQVTDIVSSRLSLLFANVEGKKIYTDTEIEQVSLLLGQIDTSWSKIPRLYIILRSIGILDLLNTFIDLGITDYWLPFAERGLPSCVHPSKRSQFIDTQQLVLTRSLDFEKGEHCYFRDQEPLPFEIKDILSSGGYGQVHQVLSTISFREYALKRLSRSAVFSGKTNRVVQQRVDCVKQFIAEINALKRLRHHHIVEFIGSYTDPKVIGLLMSPIADMDLSTYLARREIPHLELRTFFGCLVRALEFLHGESIRHKDIKPSNILVYNGSVLFTDFGLALDFSDADGSTTVSMVNGMTPKYCAPEVANLEPRNTSSDIWSLGVVFLEMIAVLKGKSVDFVYDFLKEHGSQQGSVRTNLDGTHAVIKELEATGSRPDNVALTWVQDMLTLPQLRPTAASLITSIISAGQSGERNGTFCGICCASSDNELSEFDELEI